MLNLIREYFSVCICHDIVSFTSLGVCNLPRNVSKKVAILVLLLESERSSLYLVGKYKVLVSCSFKSFCLFFCFQQIVFIFANYFLFCSDSEGMSLSVSQMIRIVCLCFLQCISTIWKILVRRLDSAVSIGYPYVFSVCCVNYFTRCIYVTVRVFGVYNIYACFGCILQSELDVRKRSTVKCIADFCFLIYLISFEVTSYYIVFKVSSVVVKGFFCTGFGQLCTVTDHFVLISNREIFLICCKEH